MEGVVEALWSSVKIEATWREEAVGGWGGGGLVLGWSWVVKGMVVVLESVVVVVIVVVHWTSLVGVVSRVEVGVVLIRGLEQIGVVLAIIGTSAVVVLSRLLLWDLVVLWLRVVLWWSRGGVWWWSWGLWKMVATHLESIFACFEVIKWFFRENKFFDKCLSMDTFF